MPTCRRRRVVVGGVLVAGAVAVAAPVASAAPSPTTNRPAPVTVDVSPDTVATPLPAPSPGPGHLAPGSDPSVLPGPVLIADRGNNRLLIVDPEGRLLWEFPRPGDLAPGQTFRVPDDAFFTPDGTQIVATQEDASVVTLIDIRTRRIVWRYGTPGHHGRTLNRLWHPDDAMMLPQGKLIVSDIKNCRLLVVDPSGEAPPGVLGDGRRPCRHLVPRRFASPNGAFPLPGEHILVTEINGAWASEMDLSGHVYWSVHIPGFTYPSDTNRVAPGVYLSVDYRHPGTVETFDRRGRVLWRFRPTGRQALNRPSLALPLPNGDIIATDDFDHRVVVIDPHTDRIVWQYGTKGRAGTGPGLLHIPDGLDLAPPYSLAAVGWGRVDVAGPLGGPSPLYPLPAVD